MTDNYDSIVGVWWLKINWSFLIFQKLGSEGVTHVLCTSGCGVRPGAPIISQNSQGSFELIGKCKMFLFYPMFASVFEAGECPYLFLVYWFWTEKKRFQNM